MEEGDRRRQAEDSSGAKTGMVEEWKNGKPEIGGQNLGATEPRESEPQNPPGAGEPRSHGTSEPARGG
jgi:hypothetical protein